MEYVDINRNMRSVLGKGGRVGFAISEHAYYVELFVEDIVGLGEHSFSKIEP